MPKDDTADLKALFDSVLSEEDEQVEQEPVEGERSPQADSPSEKTTPGSKEAAPAPATEKQDDVDASDRDERYQELLDEVKKYKKYEPLLEILEEEPQVGRQMLARKLGFVPAESVEQSQQAPVQPQQPSQQQIEDYWQKRIEDNPALAVRDLIHLATAEATKGSRQASTRVLINDYKARRRTEDPLFAQYEPYFDVMARGANPDFVLDSPDATLSAVENLALGTWAREQRQKAAKAKKGAPAVAREKPRSLEENRVSAPTNPAKKRRELTDEERELARIYGEEALDVEEEPSNPWRG